MSGSNLDTVPRFYDMCHIIVKTRGSHKQCLTIKPYWMPNNNMLNTTNCNRGDCDCSVVVHSIGSSIHPLSTHFRQVHGV